MRKMISAAIALTLMIGFAEWSVGLVEQRLEETGRQNEARIRQKIEEFKQTQQTLPQQELVGLCKIKANGKKRLQLRSQKMLKIGQSAK
ncbi:MAG: hypothetical protein ABGX16_09125 [Pirellulales bacterium]